MAFLPDILDSKAEGRNKYLQQLLSVAEKFKKSPYRQGHIQFFLSPFPICLLLAFCSKNLSLLQLCPTLQKTIAEESNFNFSCSYVWAAAGKQPDLEQRVGVGGYGYPALVALNVKKSVYAPLKSAFELDHIT